jgi:uncharacterized protein with GYD domain
MPKYLIQTAYTAEGLRGLQKDKGSGRRQAAASALESVGGRLESMHFALGDYDVVIIADLPDQLSATAVAIAACSSGMVRSKTTPLLSVEETDEALAKTVTFRAPGQAGS